MITLCFAFLMSACNYTQICLQALTNVYDGDRSDGGDNNDDDGGDKDDDDGGDKDDDDGGYKDDDDNGYKDDHYGDCKDDDDSVVTTMTMIQG